MGIVELALTILDGNLPAEALDCAYLFAQTPDNQASVLSAAARLWRVGAALRIAMPDSPPRGGYAGDRIWQQQAVWQGVPSAAIALIPTAQFDALNTLTEAQAFVSWAKEQGLKQAAVVAPVFHLPRAFITAVSVVLNEYPAFAVYAVCGEALAWDERAVHSQGNLAGRRREFVASELKRIVRYTRKGDLAPASRIGDYLRLRDRAVLAAAV